MELLSNPVGLDLTGLLLPQALWATIQVTVIASCSLSRCPEQALCRTYGGMIECTRNSDGEGGESLVQQVLGNQGPRRKPRPPKAGVWGRDGPPGGRRWKVELGIGASCSPT